MVVYVDVIGRVDREFLNAVCDWFNLGVTADCATLSSNVFHH